MATTTRQVKAQRRSAHRVRRLIARTLIYIMLLAFAFIFLYPFYNMLIGSFMDDNELFSRTPRFWPSSVDLEAYRQLLGLGSYNFGLALWNTFLIAFVQMAGTLFFTSLAGYTFAMRRFPGRDILFTAMLVTLFLPTQATLVPWYLLMVKILKWGNTFWPFWIPAWASAFGIFWMRQYIRSTIPHDLMDAAAIDGCSSWGTFIRVVFPAIRPGLAVLGILVFVSAFKDFLGPLLILSDPSKMTVQLVLANFKGSTIIAPRYSVMFAGGVLATIPMVVVFFVFQKQLIQGIMSGAVKGG